MIYLEVYAASLGRTFDFEADEECTVKEMTEEIVRILWMVSGSEGEPDPEGFRMFCQKEECILPQENTLDECAVESGSLLILA